jgi:uncharacterized protein (TIGR03435 family)
LADRLVRAAPGYIDHPVIDATGLKGGWDFTLTWTGRGAYQAAVQTRGGPQEGPPDPNGSLSLFEAVDEELALKLDRQQRRMPVVVIDRIEQTPTDN